MRKLLMFCAVVALVLVGCARKVVEVAADTVVDCLLPCDAFDVADALTPSDDVSLATAVTP